MNKGTLGWSVCIFFSLAHTILFTISEEDLFFTASNLFLAASFVILSLENLDK